MSARRSSATPSPPVATDLAADGNLDAFEHRPRRIGEDAPAGRVGQQGHTPGRKGRSQDGHLCIHLRIDPTKIAVTRAA